MSLFHGEKEMPVFSARGRSHGQGVMEKALKAKGEGRGGRVHSGKQGKMARTKEDAEVPPARSAMAPKSRSKD